MQANRKLQFIALTALLFLALLPAHATLVSLIVNVPSGPPGATLSFEGTLTNNTSSTIFLVTPSLLQTGGLTPDFSAFSATAPLQLAPNGTTGPILLFTAVIDPSTPVGTQIDAQFSLTGGTSPTDTGIATQEFFVVNVTAPATSPEPGSLSLAVCGLGALFFGSLARRNRK